MEIEALPIFDWEAAIRVTNNEALAIEIFNALIKQIPKDLTVIKEAYEDQNFKELLRLVHKLHGALCYSGAPRVKTVISHLETDLKNNILNNLSSLMTQLIKEVSLLQKQPPLPS